MKVAQIPGSPNHFSPNVWLAQIPVTQMEISPNRNVLLVIKENFDTSINIKKSFNILLLDNIIT